MGILHPSAPVAYSSISFPMLCGGGGGLTKPAQEVFGPPRQSRPNLSGPLPYELTSPGVHPVLRRGCGSLLIKEFPLWRDDKRQSLGVSLANQRNLLISGREAEDHCQSAGPESVREKSQVGTTHLEGLNLDRQVPRATSETKSGQAGTASLNNGFPGASVCPAHGPAQGGCVWALSYCGNHCP